MDSQPTVRRDLGCAVTSDGYTLWLQPDGTYTNGDLTAPDAAGVIEATDHYVTFYPPA